MMWWSLFCLRSFRAVVLSVPILSIGVFPCAAAVVINEVYYDHPGRDEGWEFVELYNAGETACDLSGWSLESLDGASGRKATIWTAAAGTRIGPGELVCVAGSSRGPASGFVLKGTLGNGPDAVRLVSPSGVADLVGYGALASSDLYEGDPAPDVAAGTSLARRPDGFDTNRNNLDLVPALPSPGRRNFFGRDAGVHIMGEEMLPCGGSIFPVKIGITNCGIDTLSGNVSIEAVLLDNGRVSSSGRSDAVLSLAVSATDSVEIRLTAPESARFEIRAYLADAPDENASNDSVLLSLASSPGVVVINEIMYRPAQGMSEWIELENRSGESCSLKAWSLCDATGSRRLVSSGDLLIPPGGFAVLAKDSASFRNEFPSCRAPVTSPEGGWPSLNDTDRGGVADVVELFDAGGVLVERVSYHDLLGSERGRSIERVSADVCSARAGGIWHRCVARARATPGEENSTRLEKAPPRHGIAVSPNPFSLKRDGETAITGQRGDDEAGAVVRIFDLDGIEVRRIFGECGGASVFSIPWDGRANDGSRVRTGLYVCLVEYIGAGGGVCRREKKCIAVAGY